ncbi:hypothetical protein BO70DRAFT_377505 [Aspergillus heteromorphus CBS 117.55]|uniref:Uncharacterized protein n=1 Tax=Aspergillus heteromorphus CBS 117.55 TaxID=1448321 RepID=A0A317WTD2_9EURO|nr:uncharacterized protein BO70DRAFT_377505 [Aspergillus heteromorphus CBS 117.55]PWY89051.1 hypothetical protein BO70DRAFT_377505 [Aspergillus heteromorphus CBS 117.55]
MESKNETDTASDVSVLPSPAKYNDISGLNPLYDDIMTLWNRKALLAATRTVVSDASSSGSSLPCMGTGHDLFRLRHESSSSPLLRQFPSSSSLYASETPDVVFHPGKQYTPSYQTPARIGSSQMAAAVEYVGHPKSAETGQTDWLDLSVIEAPLRQTPASHKKLFGEKGWLGCTADLKDLPRSSRRFKGLRGFGKKVIKQVEVLADEMAKAYPNPLNHTPLRSRAVPESHIPISLDAPTQAKLYSEMEVMICGSANRFLLQQHTEGRLSEESIRKVTQLWGAKNRPQVIEFQFDQATQRQLILANIRTLRFHGEWAVNPVLLKSTLNNWNAVSKEMGVRTFCAPDSAIRKHMHDIHKLLDMLGAPLITYLTFQELQMETLSIMKSHLEQLRHHAPAGDDEPRLFRPTGKYEQSHWMAY